MDVIWQGVSWCYVLGQHAWLLLAWASRVALSNGQLVDFIRGGSVRLILRCQLKFCSFDIVMPAVRLLYSWDLPWNAMQ
jgi:hypothetical protein